MNRRESILSCLTGLLGLKSVRGSSPQHEPPPKVKGGSVYEYNGIQVGLVRTLEFSWHSALSKTSALSETWHALTLVRIRVTGIVVSDSCPDEFRRRLEQKCTSLKYVMLGNTLIDVEGIEAEKVQSSLIQVSRLAEGILRVECGCDLELKQE